MTSPISHPQLGPIKSITSNDNEWATEPLVIEGLGFTASIHAFTEGKPPSERQLAAMAKVLGAKKSMKKEMAEEMLDAYDSDIRPSYLRAISENRIKHPLTPADLPDLEEPRQIWKVISGLQNVFVDEKGDATFEFGLKFDPEHQLTVRYVDGEIDEAGLDG